MLELCFYCAYNMRERKEGKYMAKTGGLRNKTLIVGCSSLGATITNKFSIKAAYRSIFGTLLEDNELKKH